ncbi:unnamed protein product [Schistosoma margrebowiei]|uniref:Uncharacterized protein n=1 Tax=Schistosoma margrebowiei TaxID=48269 RepID=A0A183MJA8_9TREM|nr:unnamed protein product [Schistosoma margrebowiei]
MEAGDQQLVHTPFVPAGYWSPCAPLILLSNRSVGPVIQLPQYLPNSLIKQIKNSALEEIEDIKSEITMLSEKLPGFDSPRLQRRLSRYLGSQTSLGSLSEEVTMKQIDILTLKKYMVITVVIEPFRRFQIEDVRSDKLGHGMDLLLNQQREILNIESSTMMYSNTEALLSR